MKLFSFLKKEKKEEKRNGNQVLREMILKKALKENQEKQTQIENLEKNLEVLQTTIENIKELCKKDKSTVVSKKKILEELGE